MSSMHLKKPGQQSPPAGHFMTDSSKSLCEPPMTRVLSAKSIAHIGYWNVQTPFDTSKLSKVIKEMEKYKFNILVLCDVCWTDSRKFASKDKIFIFSGSHDGIHHDGMAIILDRSASEGLTQRTSISECLMTTRYVTLHAKAMMTQCYVPPNDHEEVKKTYSINIY